MGLPGLTSDLTLQLHYSDGHLAVTRLFSCHQSSPVHLAEMELDDALSVKALTLPVSVCVLLGA